MKLKKIATNIIIKEQSEVKSVLIMEQEKVKMVL